MTREEVEVLELEIDRLRSELLRANRKIARVREVREFYPNQPDVPWKDIERALDGGTE